MDGRCTLPLNVLTGVIYTTEDSIVGTRTKEEMSRTLGKTVP